MFVEQSKDNPSSTEGARVQAGGNVTISPTKVPVTIRMRYTRTAGSNTVAAAVPRGRSGEPGLRRLGQLPGRGELPRPQPDGQRRVAVTRRARGSASSPRATSPARPARTPTAARPAPSKIDYIRVTPDPIDCEVVAPTTTATLDPAAPAAGDTYDRSVKVNLSATDGGTPAAGVEKTEYRITYQRRRRRLDDEGQQRGRRDVQQPADRLVQRHAPRRVPLDGQGGQRRGDQVGHLQGPAARSATARTSSTARAPTCSRAGCATTRNGGTPTTGALAPTLTGTGQLSLPTNNFELDAAATATALGPVNFIGQDLNALGDAWQVETQFTARYTAGWQHVGLIVWQSDGNFFRSTLTHSLSGGNLYVEQSKDTPTSTAEGARQTGGGNVTIAANKAEAITIKMRYTRAAGSNSVQAQYQVIAPAAAANADWVNFPGAATFLQLNPTAATRRDAAGSRIGIISAGNFPGTAGNAPVQRARRRDVKVDYFRITPDTCPPGADQTAPTTTATAAPAAPNGTNGWYTSDVNVTLAGNDGTNGSGIDKIEYKRRWRRLRRLQRSGRHHGGRHAHGRVPLDRQGRQRRGHQVADGQGRQGRAGDDRHDRPDHARQRSRDAHADRDRPGLRGRQERVPGQPGQPVRRVRRSVADVASWRGSTTTRPPSRSSPPPAPTRSSTARSTTPATSRPSRRSRSRSRPRTTTTSPRSRPGRWTRRARVRAGPTPSPSP